MFKYLKYYFEPKSKMVHALAFDSAKAYYKDKEKTMIQFQSYQRGYINKYRDIYAKTKLDV
jgi:hypothetical protein